MHSSGPPGLVDIPENEIPERQGASRQIPLPRACCLQTPEQNLALGKLCLGSLVLIICPNSSLHVQAVSETHKAWPENLLFNGIDLVVASCFI